MIQPSALRYRHLSQELHRRARPGKMGPIVRTVIWSSLLICAGSGLAEYWQSDLVSAFQKPLGRWALVLHGVSGMALAIGFGLLMQSHIRAAWRMKRHRVSGTMMASLMSLLMISGLLLYYGNEAIHDVSRQLHIFSGLGFVGLTLWHGLFRYFQSSSKRLN